MHDDELTVLLRVKDGMRLRYCAFYLVRVDMDDIVVDLLLALFACLRTIVLLIG